MRTYLSLIILLLHFSFLGAQAEPLLKAKSKIYQAYLSNDKAGWQEGLSLLDQLKNSSNPEEQYQWILAQYGWIGYCNSTGNKSGLIPLIDETQKLLKKLIKEKGESASYLSLMGGLIAMEIEMKPAQMIFLGPKCSSNIHKAVELDPKNPFAWIEMGNMKYHAPSIFGGDMEEAIQCFEQALKYFDQQTSLKYHNWPYLHTLAWLGKAYEEEEEWDKAIAIYQRALAEEPSFSWIKNELLPQAKSKR